MLLQLFGTRSATRMIMIVSYVILSYLFLFQHKSLRSLKYVTSVPPGADSSDILYNIVENVSLRLYSYDMPHPPNHYIEGLLYISSSLPLLLYLPLIISIPFPTCIF